MGHPKALWVLGKEPGIDTYHSKGGISCGKRPDMQKTAAVETRGEGAAAAQGLRNTESTKRGEGTL